jgi:hypothetical protein
MRSGPSVLLFRWWKALVDWEVFLHPLASLLQLCRVLGYALESGLISADSPSLTAA